MKRVRKHDVAKDASWIIIAEINRGIELKVACDIAGETDRRRVFRTALPINLHPPRLIEIVSVAQDCFVFVASVNGSGD